MHEGVNENRKLTVPVTGEGKFKRPTEILKLAIGSLQERLQLSRCCDDYCIVFMPCVFRPGLKPDLMERLRSQRRLAVKSWAISKSFEQVSASRAVSFSGCRRLDSVW